MELVKSENTTQKTETNTEAKFGNKSDGGSCDEKMPLKTIIEAIILSSNAPMSLDKLQMIFDEDKVPEKPEIRAAIDELKSDYEGRSFELTEVASGYRIQVKQDMQPWVSRLWEEKPQKYSRAFLETLAIIAYRQPITRGEIEEIRGVSISSQIMKTLIERNWIRVVGRRDVPGHPSLYGTTKEFLNYFNMKSLDDLPSLMELRDITEINAELDLTFADEESADEDGADNQEANTGEDQANNSQLDNDQIHLEIVSEDE